MSIPGSAQKPRKALKVTDAARRLVEQVNEQGGTYHRLDLGDGLVVEGDYDMDTYLPYYGLPESLDGKSVLDVGTSSGYFAIESRRRGGQVTAIDIWPDTNLLVQLSRAFDLGIDYVSKDVYDLDSSFGEFDLVICGSLLLHLPDPLGALRALRSVTRERLIVSSAATEDSAETDQPVCHFFGARATEADYWAYWGFSACGLERLLLAAGFSRVGEVRHFDLRSEPGRMEFMTPHVSMSAYV
ncbi:class I SAM-dependent methyltransferase [Qaidamihabitans albus]|uniref:class I SAM-dependent methyltransferase n=1 Tax=Qaidamihabitans albus TaxID=2795733 RepID=UPI0018F23BF7|nr:methyltransferase domain-containing protein [Qaidamihabitans albus]